MALLPLILLLYKNILHEVSKAVIDELKHYANKIPSPLILPAFPTKEIIACYLIGDFTLF